MDTASCPHCGAPIKPTATFCLACDRPIVDTERGLSVAETTVAAARARPVLVSVVVVGVLALLGGSAYGVLHFVSGRHHNAESQAATDARDAVVLLVRAEGGDTHACRRVGALILGSDARNDCLAIVDHDPGAQLEGVHTDLAHLGGTTGTIRLTASVADDHGTRRFEDVVDLTKQGKQWRMRWNGAPPA